MISAKFRLLLLFTFLSVTTLVVVLLYNSNKNIDKLISGNEDLLEEFEIKDIFQSLLSGLHSIDNNIRRAIIIEHKADRGELDAAKDDVTSSAYKLGQLLENAKTYPLWIRLDSLVGCKINFSDSVIYQLDQKGASLANELINTRRGIVLNDQIKEITLSIGHSRQMFLTKLVMDNDENSKRAKEFELVLAGLAAMLVLLVFLYIIHHVGRQQQLIVELNESERKVREGAQIKEMFIANMSHEIRTPLNAILGFTSLLKKQRLIHPQKQYVEHIQNSSETLLSILNDILDLSKIEAGMMHLERAPFSTHQLVQKIQNLFQHRIEKKKLAWQLNVEQNVPSILTGDAIRLTQIIVNLLSNAVKFTHKGFVSLYMAVNNRTDTENDDKIWLEIVVADSGIGIAEKNLQLVFERFTQAEDSTTRRFGGTGLGLSIVKQLVTLLDGKIAVESKEEVGSVFTVTLPFEVPSEKSIAISNGTEHMKGSKIYQHENLRVLVVEDNVLNQQLMIHILATRDIKCEIVSNGKEAIEVLENTKFDIVLMDVQMPVMDGYTATQFIRQQMKLEVPIIAMTAHAFTGEREKCIGFGMTDYISKPINDEILFNILSNYTNSNKLPEETAIANTALDSAIVNLTYLHEISGGDKLFEKEIIQQFMLQVPSEVSALCQAGLERNIPMMNSSAHNLKTSVSFLGFLPVLKSHLDELESATTNTASSDIQEKIDAVKFICERALEEASALL